MVKAGIETLITHFCTWEEPLHGTLGGDSTAKMPLKFTITRGEFSQQSAISKHFIGSCLSDYCRW